MPASVFAADPVFAPGSSLTFSKGTFFTGDLIRMYVIVVNNKYKQLSGTLGFYVNTEKIGSSNFGPLNFEQAAEVAHDWVPTYGDLTIRAESTNLTATKEDGTVLTMGNPELGIGGYVEINYFVDRDTDKDGIGNRLDADDDSDNVADEQEKEFGTSPILADTDGDGLTDRLELDRNYNPLKTDTDGDSVPDGKDAFPLDLREQTDSNNNDVGDNADKEAALKNKPPPETPKPEPVPEKQKPVLQPSVTPAALAAESPVASVQTQETVLESSAEADAVPEEVPASAEIQDVSELQTPEALAPSDNRLNSIKKVVLIAGLISLAIAFVFGALWLKKRSH